MTDFSANAYHLFIQLRRDYGQNFLSEMDKKGNNDGTTVRTEFYSFIRGAYGTQATNETLQEMWTYLDTNQKGMIGENIKNYNALDTVEIAKAHDDIEKLYPIVGEALEKLHNILASTGITDEKLITELEMAIEQEIFKSGKDVDIETIIKDAVTEYQKKQAILNYTKDFNELIKDKANYQTIKKDFPNNIGEIELLAEKYVADNYDNLESGMVTIDDLATRFDSEVVAEKLAFLNTKKAFNNYFSDKTTSTKFYTEVLKNIGFEGTDKDGKIENLVNLLQKNASSKPAIANLLNELKANAEKYIKEDGSIDEDLLIADATELFLANIDKIFTPKDIGPTEAYNFYEAQVDRLDEKYGDGKDPDKLRDGIQKAADSYISSLIAHGYSDIVEKCMKDNGISNNSFKSSDADRDDIEKTIKDIQNAIKKADDKKDSDPKTNKEITGINDFTTKIGQTTKKAMTCSGASSINASSKFGTVHVNKTNGHRAANGSESAGTSFELNYTPDFDMIRTVVMNRSMNNGVGDFPEKVADSIKLEAKDHLGNVIATKTVTVTIKLDTREEPFVPVTGDHNEFWDNIAGNSTPVNYGNNNGTSSGTLAGTQGGSSSKSGSGTGVIGGLVTPGSNVNNGGKSSGALDELIDSGEGYNSYNPWADTKKVAK